MKMINLFALLLVLWFGAVSCDKSTEIEEQPNPGQEQVVKESNHPFLIVTRDMYVDLREKSLEEPWKSMKADALARSQAGSSDDAYKLQEYIGAAALAYILDEGKEAIHAERVKNAIINQYSKLKPDDNSGWGGVVPHLGSFFSAILALDIVYDALSAEDIASCENVIRNQIFKLDREGSWKTVRYGTHGTWDIYKGETPEAKDKYYNATMHQITPDGVSPVTNHYAWERVGGGNSRVSKSGFMDVLEFTGIDKRYYNNERIQKFQRWLFGSSINCNKEMAIFGDMLPTQGIGNYMLLRRVVNFDMEAAGYAAWYLDGIPAIGHILTYILPKQALPDPVVPESKFYENGGAFFREKEDDPIGLQAVLYNIKTQDEWHTHNEVNGLAFSGLGNRLLVNGGRLGAPTRAAELNNTLSINGDDHSSRTGNGIIEGFTADGLDFAVGDDGDAIPGKEHKRNLILVHKSNGMNAYFICFDEIEASTGDKIENYLHPANQSKVDILSPLTEYSSSIDHYPTKEGSALDFFFLTPPEDVVIDKSPGAVQDRYPGYPEHSRLTAKYDVNNEGLKNIATIMFPYDAAHPKAEFQKIEDSSFNGCILSQGNINDIIIESMSGEEIIINGIRSNADLTLVRKMGEEVPFYFVRNGLSLKISDLGFESDSPISIWAKGTEGNIVSNGARLKITGAGINEISFEPSVEILDSGAGFIEVDLSEGSYQFK